MTPDFDSSPQRSLSWEAGGLCRPPRGSQQNQRRLGFHEKLWDLYIFNEQELFYGLVCFFAPCRLLPGAAGRDGEDHRMSLVLHSRFIRSSADWVWGHLIKSFNKKKAPKTPACKLNNIEQSTTAFGSHHRTLMLNCVRDPQICRCMKATEEDPRGYMPARVFLRSLLLIGKALTFWLNGLLNIV